MNQIKIKKKKMDENHPPSLEGQKLESYKVNLTNIGSRRSRFLK